MILLTMLQRLKQNDIFLNNLISGYVLPGGKTAITDVALPLGIAKKKAEH